MRKEQNISRWGNCKQMMCMFAGIAKCTPASLALFCQVLGLLQALLPMTVLGGQSKPKLLILVFYLKIQRGKEKRQRLWCWPQSSSLQQLRRTLRAEASQHHSPMDTCSWKAGLSLEVLLHSFEFSSSWRASFSVIQGERWGRSCFWAGLWGSCASPVVLCPLAAPLWALP